MLNSPEKVKIEVVDFPTGSYVDVLIPDKFQSRFKNELPKCLRASSQIMGTIFSWGGSSDTIKIDKRIAEGTFIYSGMRVNAYVRGEELQIGPIVGVFTTPSAIKAATSQRASSRMNYLIKANRAAGTILYYFSMNDINLRESKIRGTYYNNTLNRWEQCLFPFPEVLYDREGDTPEDYLKTVKAIRENSSIKRINPVYLFDKWEIYERLQSYRDMQQYLPYTVMYKGTEDLTDMFEKNSTLYIKDTRGNRGLGVARIIKNTDGTFELSHFNKGIHNYYFSSVSKLVNKIDMLFHDKKLILQCAIETIRLEGCNVDMRATLQRGRGGELAIIAYPVRVGSPGSPVTSTVSGSQVYTFEEFFKTKLNYTMMQLEELRLKIDSFLFRIYKCIEELYGNFGEIGIDFAVDRSGRLWFIECNAKPGKDTVFMSCSEEVANKAFLNPLEYAKYLCEHGN